MAGTEDIIDRGDTFTGESACAKAEWNRYRSHNMAVSYGGI